MRILPPPFFPCTLPSMWCKDSLDIRQGDDTEHVYQGNKFLMYASIFIKPSPYFPNSWGLKIGCLSQHQQKASFPIQLRRWRWPKVLLLPSFHLKLFLWRHFFLLRAMVYPDERPKVRTWENTHLQEQGERRTYGGHNVGAIVRVSRFKP